MNQNPCIGSCTDDFFKEEGILEEINKVAVKRVAAWEEREESEDFLLFLFTKPKWQSVYDRLGKL